ncbi:hypothetical protein TNCV_385491 [Trichonephila clavipes]|nr:hypothetical protein TNCV_385491 [Trichonephila clavipes]
MSEAGIFSFELHPVGGWRGVPPDVKDCRGVVQLATFSGYMCHCTCGDHTHKGADSQLCGGNVTVGQNHFCLDVARITIRILVLVPP